MSVSIGVSSLQTYTDTLHDRIRKRLPTWQQTVGSALRALPRSGGAITLEVSVTREGTLQPVHVGHSSVSNRVEDAARELMLSLNAMPPPPNHQGGEWDGLCVVRIGAVPTGRRRAEIEITVSCDRKDLDGWSLSGNSLTRTDDAGAQLMQCRAAHGAADLPRALDRCQRAVEQAPNWALVHRDHGLLLLQAGQETPALTHLTRFVDARKPNAALRRIVHRLAAHRAGQTMAQNAELAPRSHLSKADIARTIAQGFPMLEPCLEPARHEHLLEVGTDTLVLNWTIKSSGEVERVRLSAPEALDMTDHADCVERVVRHWHFPPFRGRDEITLRTVPLKVRGSESPPRAPEALTASAPVDPSVFEQATIASCERSQTEIGAYIRAHFNRLTQCLLAERQRLPSAVFPDTLPVGFVVDPDGTVREVGARHRHFRDGPVATCIRQALEGSMAPSGGAVCPAEFGLTLRGL